MQVAGPNVGAVITQMQRSDSLAPAVCIHSSGKHLPTALAVGWRQIYHRLAQSALCESVTAPQAVRAIGPLSRARGLALASAAATRSARSASQQVIAKLYIAYDRRYKS